MGVTKEAVETKDGYPPGLVEPDLSQIDWQEVLQKGIERMAKIKSYRESNRLLTGRVFELLGHKAMSELFPPPHYLVTKPKRTARIKKFMTPDEYCACRPHFPDALILQNLNVNAIRLVGIGEYKLTAPFLFSEYFRNQFEGFTRLVNFLRQRQNREGREILEKLLRQKIVKLEVPQEVRFIYIVPADKAAKWIPRTQSARNNFQEVLIPLTSKDIIREIEIYKRKNPRLFLN